MTKSFEEIKNELVKMAKINGAKTNNSLVVAMVGVTGSGNSTISRALKSRLGWDIIEKK